MQRDLDIEKKDQRLENIASKGSLLFSPYI